MDTWIIGVYWTDMEPYTEYVYASRELMIEHWNGLLMSPVVQMLALIRNGTCLTTHDVEKERAKRERPTE